MEGDIETLENLVADLTLHASRNNDDFWGDKRRAWLRSVKYHVNKAQHMLSPSFVKQIETVIASEDTQSKDEQDAAPGEVGALFGELMTGHDPREQHLR